MCRRLRTAHISVLETCTTAFASVQVEMLVPRGRNECECDWIAICVMRLRLLYEAYQMSESGYALACDCCWSPQRSRRSHRMECFKCSWRVLTSPRAQNPRTSDSSAHVVVEYMGAVLDRRAGAFVKHQRCGFQRTLHNLSKCAESTFRLSDGFCVESGHTVQQ